MECIGRKCLSAAGDHHSVAVDDAGLVGQLGLIHLGHGGRTAGALVSFAVLLLKGRMGIEGFLTGREALGTGIGHHGRCTLLLTHHHEHHAEVTLELGHIQGNVQSDAVGGYFDGLCIVNVREVGLVLIVQLGGALGMGIVKELDIAPGDQCGLVAGLSQIQRSFPAGIAAADDHYVMAQLLLFSEHVLSQINLGIIGALDGNPLCGGAQSRDDHVIALALQQLGGGFGVQMHGDIGFFNLTNQPVLIILEVPLEIHEIREFQLAAQRTGFFIQGHGMSLLHAEQCRAHTRRAAADDHNFLLLAGGVEHPVQHMMITGQGVHGAEAAMAAVAQQAGGDVLAMTGLDFVVIMLVADERAGHGYAVAFALGNEPVNEIGIVEAAYGREGAFDATGLCGSSELQVIGRILVEVVAVYVGVGAVPAANLEDVHQTLAELAIGQPILQGIAALLGGGGLTLDQKVRAAGLFDPAEDLQSQSSTLGHGFSAVLIGAVVEPGAQGAGKNAAPVAGIDGHAIKAHALKVDAGVDKILNHSLQPLGGNGGFFKQVGGIVAGHGNGIPVGNVGNHHVLGLDCHHRSGCQAALGMDFVDDLHIGLAALGIVHVAGGHAAVISLTIGQRTNANTDQRCAVSGQMLIEGAGELRFHFVGRDALGVEHPVFQGDVSNL